jgi:hypothetical protein
LADGKAPFENIHPTRALFQIVSNPPPTLYRPASWTQLLNDFISEYGHSKLIVYNSYFFSFFVNYSVCCSQMGKFSLHKKKQFFSIF